MINQSALKSIIPAGLFVFSFNFLFGQNTGKYLVINPEGHRATIQDMAIDKNGKAITAGFDKTCKIWNTKEGFLERQIYGQIGPGAEGMIYEIAISDDNKYLATGGWFGENKGDNPVGDIRVYKYATGEQIRLFKGHFNTIKDLEFYTNSNFLLSYDADGKVIIWDVETADDVVLEDIPTDLTDIELIEGKMVTSHSSGMVYLWDIVNIVDGGKPKKSFKKLADQGIPANRVAINGYGTRVAVAAGTYVYILDENMNELYSFSHGEDEVTAINFSPDGSRIVVASSGYYVKNNKVTVYEERDKEWYILSSYNQHTDLVKCAAFINNSTCVTAGGLNHEVVVWKVETKKKNSTVLHYMSGAGRPIYSVGMRGDQLAFSNVWDKTNGSSTFDEVFDLSSREFRPYTELDTFEYPVLTMGDRSFVVSNDYTTLTIKKGKSTTGKVTLDITNGSYHKAVTFVNEKYIVSGAAYGVINAYDLTGQHMSELVAHEGDIRGLGVSSDGKFLISTSHDQTVRLWRIDEIGVKKIIFPAVSLFLGANKEWVMWNEEGYFASSKKGASYVGYHVNVARNKSAKYYPFEQFDVMYNRPDIIMSNLGFVDSAIIDLYHSAYLKRLKRMGLEEGDLSSQMNCPYILIKPEPVVKGTVKIGVTVKDSLYPIKSVQVYINDVPALGRSGLDVSSLNTQKLVQTLSIELMSGLNKVQISATNSVGIESLKETVMITNNTPVASNLYVVSVGVSNYKDTLYNLDYASKDAEDVSALFGQATHFKSVQQKVLVDKQVTKNNLLALKDFLSTANRDDVVIFFVAGHGVLNKTLDYYYCTYDMDFLAPEKNGITYAELEQLFDGIKAIRKILIMDTCHSGEVDKDDVEEIAFVNTEMGDITFRSTNTATTYREAQGLQKTNEAVKEMFNDLRRGTGATVISSAGGAEYAMESDEWKNGLFTYCLLEGIKTLNADTDKNGEIMLSELQNYINSRVTELSQGRQMPTSRFENLSLDYRIW